MNKTVIVKKSPILLSKNINPLKGYYSVKVHKKKYITITLDSFTFKEMNENIKGGSGIA